MTDLADRRGLDGTVYQPAEDSRLLAEVATGRVGPEDRVLDVGTGSGYVAAEIQAATDAQVIATDVNPHACRAARERGVEAIMADLLDPIAAAAVDVVVCNPPYLPGDPADVGIEEDWMAVALSGGSEGLAVIEPLLADVGRVLRDAGEVLLLVSSLAGVDAVIDLADDAGFSAVALADHSFPFETLTVLALRR